MTTTFVPTIDPTASIDTVRSSKRSVGVTGLAAGAVAGTANIAVAAIAQPSRRRTSAGRIRTQAAPPAPHPAAIRSSP